MAEAIQFKFKYLDDAGNEQGFLSKKGAFDGEQVMLDGTALPVDAVIKAMLRFNRLMLLVPQQDGEVAAISMAVTGGSATKLHSAINMIASERQARRHLEHLQEKGRAGEFRVVTCAHCQSTVDVSSLPQSPQVHCPFCDAIATVQGDPPPGEAKYRHCDQCDLFAQPKGFTVFYFYFLLVVYGYRYRKMYMCNTCMRKEAWKMLGGNLIFLLGVPTAITQLVRAYAGGSTFSKAYAGLDAGNALFKAGRYDKAAQQYQVVADRLGAAAGVRYNHGLAMAAANRFEDAAVQFEFALADCANYTHAAEALYGCYERLGRHDDAEALKKLFNEEEEEAAGELVEG